MIRVNETLVKGGSGFQNMQISLLFTSHLKRTVENSEMILSSCVYCI